jgi:hypothetical protein
MFVKIAVGVEGFDQAAGVNANERNLFGETGDIGGFDPGKVTLFEAAGVETVFKVIQVTRRCATATRRGGGRHEVVLLEVGYGKKPKKRVLGSHAHRAPFFMKPFL